VHSTKANGSLDASPFAPSTHMLYNCLSTYYTLRTFRILLCYRRYRVSHIVGITNRGIAQLSRTASVRAFVKCPFCALDPIRILASPILLVRLSPKKMVAAMKRRKRLQDQYQRIGGVNGKNQPAQINQQVLTMYFLCFSVCIYSL
jgi:hypothetical protein